FGIWRSPVGKDAAHSALRASHAALNWCSLMAACSVETEWGLQTREWWLSSKRRLRARFLTPAHSPAPRPARSASRLPAFPGGPATEKVPSSAARTPAVSSWRINVLPRREIKATVPVLPAVRRVEAAEPGVETVGG